MLKTFTVWITTNYRKFYKRWEYQTTCHLLRNLYASKEATVRNGHGTTDWFQIGKAVCQGCIFSPCLFNLYADYIMWKVGLDEAQAGIKIAAAAAKSLQSCPTLCDPTDGSQPGSPIPGILQARILEWVAISFSRIKIARRNINNLRNANDTTLMAESEEELKKLLMKVREESENAGLNLNIQKAKMLASGPITSWQTDGKTMETVTNYFLGSKITADGDCSHEIKRRLLFGRKATTNLDSILKSWDITLPKKVCLVKAMIFCSSHEWMWELDYRENWLPKNWCFRTVVSEKTLESPLDCKEIQPVHPTGNHPEYSLEGLMLKLKLQYFGHLMLRTDSLEKTLMLGKTEGRRRRGWQRMRWLDDITSSTQWTWVWASFEIWWWTGKPGVLQSMVLQRVGHDQATGLSWKHLW